MGVLCLSLDHVSEPVIWHKSGELMQLGLSDTILYRSAMENRGSHRRKGQKFLEERRAQKSVKPMNSTSVLFLLP